jgi:hypothetical protein
MQCRQFRPRRVADLDKWIAAESACRSERNVADALIFGAEDEGPAPAL